MKIDKEQLNKIIQSLYLSMNYVKLKTNKNLK